MRYDRKRETFIARCSKLSEAREAAFQVLLAVRTSYIRTYPNRNFTVNARDMLPMTAFKRPEMR